MINWSLYQKVLGSTRWQLLKQEKEELTSSCCERCGKHRSGTGSFSLHHKHYNNLGEETVGDVELLCKECHHGADIERILANAKILNRRQFIEVYARTRNVDASSISENEFKESYADYINYLYCVRVGR